MAERRMFAKTIIDSDAFLDMPLTAQALYFHLSMRADDDGFVNNPKKIQRMIGATDKDCKLLISNKFIITFESGIIVIKHWKIHNYIRNDRYKETVYQEEKSRLIEKENKAYTEIESENKTLGIPNGYQMDTQDRLGKDSIDKDSIGKDSCASEDAPKTADKIDFDAVINSFNQICVDLPKVKSVSDSRKRAIKSAYNDIIKFGGFDAFFQKANASDFLCGRKKDNLWKCSFDWVIKKQNVIKIIEGNYDNPSSQYNISKNNEKYTKGVDYL